MKRELRILILEDLDTDAELIKLELRKSGLIFSARRVETEDDFVHELDNFLPDIVLADYALPSFNGLSALAITRKKSPGLPFIIITGTLGDELAIETFKGGATDYVLKDRLARLVPAINRAMLECKEREGRERAERTLAENEARLRILVQTIPDLIWLKDLNGVFLTCNPMFERFYGAKEADIIGKTDYDFVSKDLADFFREHDREAMVAGKPRTNEEWLAFADDGYRGLFHTIKTPMRDAEGNIIGILGIARDITARVKSEEEKEKLEVKLMQAQKMEAIGQFAGGVAHDFNNILSAIIGYGHLALMKMENDDPQRLNIESMLEGADRAAHLTKDLLLFSRKQVSECKPVDLNEIVTKVEKFLLRVIGEDIECKTVLHENPISVLADSNQLEQVLMNFATNARDAMPNGGAFVITTEIVTIDSDFISDRGCDKPVQYALITVSDTGNGMDEETRQRIFEPFFTTKEVGKGTGLGLAVVYGIIKQHDGYIKVNSEPGKGTTFQLYLPVIMQKAREVSKVHQEVAPAGGTETVLLAEDDASLRKLSKIVLTKYGYTVIEAVDGVDAVRKYTENEGDVDLLLFDLIMPKMNGKEAYEEILRKQPYIKVIFASGYAPDHIRQNISLGDGVSLLFKPATPSELLKKVRSVLDGTN